MSQGGRHASVSEDSGRQRFVWAIQGVLAVLSVCVVILFIAFVALRLRRAALMPVQKIIFVGHWKYLNVEKLKQPLVPLMHQRSWWGMSLFDVRESLLKLPWVSSVNVSREWPYRLRAVVKERQPMMRWGENAWLDGQGIVFKPDKKTSASIVNSSMPILRGPVDQADLIFARYQLVASVLSALHLKVTGMSETPGGQWQFSLKNGMVVFLGREDFTSRLQRFVATYPQLVALSKNKIRKVDLRYADGLAISR